MNAYELANKMEQLAGHFHNEAINMLRQQADRIAELEKCIEDCYIVQKKQADRIAELEETINACYTVQKMQAEEVYKGNDRIAELEKELKRTKFAWNLAENEIERLSNKDKSGNSISAEEYQKTHEGFSTIEKVIAKHEAIPSRKEAIDKAREWLKDYRVEAVFDTPQTKPLSDEEIIDIWLPFATDGIKGKIAFARAILKKAREK